MDNIHVVKETTLTVEKKPIVLFFPYFVSISLQTKTKKKISFENIPSCRKLQKVFKNETRQQLSFQGSDSQRSYFRWCL